MEKKKVILNAVKTSSFAYCTPSQAAVWNDSKSNTVHFRKEIKLSIDYRSNEGKQTKITDFYSSWYVQNKSKVLKEIWLNIATKSIFRLLVAQLAFFEKTIPHFLVDQKAKTPSLI